MNHYSINNPKQVKYYHSLEEENFTGVVKDSNGDIAYYVNGKLHREDGPALLDARGNISYYKNGLLHRDGGPSIFFHKGSLLYHKNGKRHRTDGPAAIFVGSPSQYWVDGIEISVSSDEELSDYLQLRIFE